MFAVKTTGAEPAKVNAPEPSTTAGKVASLVLLKLTTPLLLMVTADVGAKLAMASL